MAWTRLTNSTTADADDVHSDLIFIGAGDRLPYEENTAGTLNTKDDTYNLGTTTSRWKNLNLSGVGNIEGGIQTDNAILKTMLVSIGAWDMNATSQVIITHGIADYTKVVDYNVTIRDDNNSSRQNLMCVAGAAAQIDGESIIQTTTMTLLRVAGGGYDQALYDSMTTADNNRGWVLVTYEA